LITVAEARRNAMLREIERRRAMLGGRVRQALKEVDRSILGQIRVASKQELKDRIMAAVDYFNNDPVVHTWTYKLDRAA
jgi:hypothetical protein